MEITEVRIKLMDEQGERLKAFCSITFDDCFVVRDLKIIEGVSGPFVAMPSRKLTAHCPACRAKNHLRAGFCNQCGAKLPESPMAKDDEGRSKLYADIAHPINSTCREMIQARVVQSFENEKERARQPGYVSSYDEFDAGDVGEEDFRPAKKAAAAEHTHVSPAEEPRGPHKAPPRTQPATAHQPPATAHQPPSPRHSRKGPFGAGIFE